MMARRYGTFTPARRAALRRASIISANKRRGTGKKRLSTRTRRNIKRAAITTGVVGAVGGGLVARHKLSGSSFTRTRHGPVGALTGNITGSRPRSITHGRVTHMNVVGGTTKGSKARVIGRIKGGYQVTYAGKKQGPLGSYSSIKYTHHPLKPSHVLGRKTSATTAHQPYKPTKADLKTMARHNYPKTPEAYQSAALKLKGKRKILLPSRDTGMYHASIGHPTPGRLHTGPFGAVGKLTKRVPSRSVMPKHFGGGKVKGQKLTGYNKPISEAEAMRRTAAYKKSVEAKGKKVTYAHQQAALGYFRGRKAYTGGTVKQKSYLNKRARREFRKERRIRKGLRMHGSTLK